MIKATAVGVGSKLRIAVYGHDHALRSCSNNIHLPTSTPSFPQLSASLPLCHNMPRPSLVCTPGMSGQRQGTASFKPKAIYGMRTIAARADARVSIEARPLFAFLQSTTSFCTFLTCSHRPWHKKLHPWSRAEAFGAVQAQQTDQQIQKVAGNSCPK